MERVPDLGTSVANSGADMSDRSHSTLSAHPTFEYAAARVDGSIAATPAMGVPEMSLSTGGTPHDIEVPAVAETQNVSDPHRAVEVVLHAIDRAAGREQTSVKLEFSVGDADLVVQVKLHADEVRTTFQTDSADLRDALAFEWQAVSSSSGDRAVRLAAPVFSSEEAPAQESSTGNGASQSEQQDRSARQEDAATNGGFARGHGRTSAAPSAATPAASLTPSTRPLTSSGTAQRLNSFA